LVTRAEDEVQNVVRPLLILAAIAAVAIYFLIHFWKRPVTVGDPKELPIIGTQVAAKIEQSAPKIEACPTPTPCSDGASSNGVEREPETRTPSPPARR